MEDKDFNYQKVKKKYLKFEKISQDFLNKNSSMKLRLTLKSCNKSL